MSGARVKLTDQDYRAILAFRDRLRRFLAWSEKQARAAGLTPAQHQLLLAVRGHPGTVPPTIGDIAEHLRLRHHSAVGLIDRAEVAGLVERVPDRDDRRVVHIRLLPAGREALDDLTSFHLEELQVLAETFAGFRIPSQEPGSARRPDPAVQRGGNGSAD
jgi:DNA-binding MarR family transcriptional regulator